MRQKPNTRGFTLIETLIYLSLYAIIISGALAAVYSIFESSAHNQARAMVQEEGTFLIGKIDWAASNVVSIQDPATTGEILNVTQYNGTTFSFTRDGQDLKISQNGATPEILNNENVGITQLVFTHTKSTSDGIQPESIMAAVTVTATTSDGHAFSQKFTTVKYLRK